MNNQIRMFRTITNIVENNILDFCNLMEYNEIFIKRISLSNNYLNKIWCTITAFVNFVRIMYHQFVAKTFLSLAFFIAPRIKNPFAKDICCTFLEATFHHCKVRINNTHENIKRDRALS